MSVNSHPAKQNAANTMTMRSIFLLFVTIYCALKVVAGLALGTYSLILFLILFFFFFLLRWNEAMRSFRLLKSCL